MFGLELRRKGNLNNIFSDVDAVLKANGVVRNTHFPPDVVRLSVSQSLQTMFQKQYFDICAVKACADTAQMHIEKQREDFYRSLHCVSWGEMLPETKSLLVAMVLDDFRDVLNPAKEIGGAKQ